ncbi:hypothetical protein B0H17DRAFT_1193222 [Mycena rosella]|uniref:Uncharacterized protein n=1 Tax=Mycena rosella TaxID=1033263 RepID=A0AAD7GUF6_MYCRO|nr:hypothetical protein B0H17DRAFT_1193222 [Mycena rosella]
MPRQIQYQKNYSANNSSVDIIDGLRAETASLRAEVTELHAAKRKRDVGEAPTYSDDVFLPAVKRISPSTVVTANPLPPVALVAHTYPTDIPTAPPAAGSHYDAAPGFVPKAPPAVSAHQNTAVEIGPMQWDKDISGQVRALIGRMARGSTIDADAVKSLHAKRFAKNNRFITVFFPTNIAAIQFVNGWAAAPAPGFERVSVSFASSSSGN